MTTAADSRGGDVHRGLAGVVVDTTAISKVNPETNSLLYRGYPVQELAAQCSFDEVAWLLWHGSLPSDTQLDAFRATAGAERAMPPAVVAVIDALPMSAHPMDVVRTAVSTLGASDPLADDSTASAEYAKAASLYAVLPAIVAYAQRRRRGLPIVEPDPSLSYEEDFLRMTFGSVPSASVVDAFRVSLVLYAEHSFNASTFTARVVTSTLSDMHSAVTAAIGALKGPLHGGANEAVMEMFDAIGPAAGAAAWLDAALASKQKIMGFGHRVYKRGDSRVPTMHDALVALALDAERQDLLDLYDALADAMESAKGVLPNLDYPSGPAYHLMGFDTDLFTPIFVAARVTGWTAHIMEQRASNALIRPLSEYAGEDERHVPGV